MRRREDMNCARHPNRAAVGQCSQCGAYVCDECAEATKSVRDEAGTVCVNCYCRGLEAGAEELMANCRKRLRKIIISTILYAIGIMLIVSVIVTKAEGGQLVAGIVVGAILCGIYLGIAGWRAGKQAHEEHERKHGVSYTITDSGVYRETGFWGKLFGFLLYAAFGILITPISIIVNIVGMKKDKMNAELIEQEVQSVSKI